MNPVEIIESKRDGLRLDASRIEELVRQYTIGEVPDYQMSAFMMAVYFQGMDSRETVALTRAMLDSGERVVFEGLETVPVDKHSTGGVGDKITLPLTPLVAAAGVPVPMLSGRSLGHTGGTLDKLESIPGFRTALDLGTFQEGVRRVGAVIMGQTEDIAPADRKMYHLRDVTGTVPQVSLITASILSKKAAGGAKALVLDVKCGLGAFMKTREDARALATSLRRVGEELGLRIGGFLTAMDQPIGRFVGNALEVRESIEVLRGEGPADTRELTLTLAAEMLLLAGKADSREEATGKLESLIRGGKGIEKFREMIEFQGGNPEVVDTPGLLPTAPSVEPVHVRESGFLARLDARKVGLAAAALGAGRRRMEDRIDPAVGIELLRKCGEEVQPDEPVARLHCGEESNRDEALRLFLGGIRVQAEPPSTSPLILEPIV